MRRLLAVSVGALLLGACFVGPSTGSFAPATGPGGVWADLRLTGVRVQGELLDVRDSGLVVLRGDRVAFVPLPSIQFGRFRQRGTLIHLGAFVSGRAREAAQRLSRFPRGLPPDRWAALLAAHGQTELDRVAP